LLSGGKPERRELALALRRVVVVIPIEDIPEDDFAEECRWWADAIIAHFIESARPGSPVFLSVDDDVLSAIGEERGRTCDDFLSLIRRQWVRRIQRVGKAVRTEVILTASSLRRSGDPRRYVTFLAAMVLAAHRMETEAIEASVSQQRLLIDEKNYFQRLRQVLGLEWQRETGRPVGMKKYEEEALWEWWNAWLQASGWQITARPGKDGSPRRYINYPLSQTMLREGDRRRLASWLCREAHDDHAIRTLDQDGLLGWMLSHKHRLHLPRLWQILERPQDVLRFEATASAAFDVYSSVDWAEEPANTQEVVRTVRRLSAGLYREEDFFTGEVCYSIYPKQPSDAVEHPLTVTFSGLQERLRPDRVGWFSPLRLGLSPPPAAVVMGVEGHPTIRELVFPARAHWILTSDPLSAGGGAFATWGPPSPDRPFILLCRPVLVPFLERLRDLRVIDWSGEIQQVSKETWVECRECRICTSTRRVRDTEMTDAEQSLLRDLRPRSAATVRFEGGLRCPDRRESWMAEYLPRIRIEGVAGTIYVTITNLQHQRCEFTQEVRGSEEVDLQEVLPNLNPGYYRIDAIVREGHDSERALPGQVLAVRGWESLEYAFVGGPGIQG
jgi:hypothetical protein